MATYASSSRYAINSSGRAAEAIRKRNSGQYRLYTVRQGDTLERIALRSFGDTSRYWELADLNPQVRFPLTLSVGDVIRVPI